MRVGLSTPIVVQVPGVASAWESNGTAEDLVRIAKVADALGYEHLTCSEHVAVPTAAADRRGAMYWDPLATLSFLAAHTSRVRLATAVLVLAYHHPLEIAKRYGTLDRLSAGRLILGLGIGSLKEEFDLIGAPWARRGARADDAIGALRASLSTAEPAHDGPFYSYSGMTVLPHAVQARVPIWMGGRTLGSLRRAAQFTDGWMPFGLDVETVTQMLTAVTVPADFDVVLSTGHAVDPGRDPDGVRRVLRSLAGAGATAVTCTIAADSPDHYCDQLDRLKDIADTIDAGGS